MPIVTRVPAYQPPEPAPLPAIYLPAETAWTILSLRRAAATPWFLETYRATCLREAQKLADFYLIPRPVLS